MRVVCSSIFLLPGRVSVKAQSKFKKKELDKQARREQVSLLALHYFRVLQLLLLVCALGSSTSKEQKR